MGLTERHWFENEDVPENYEWALEDAVYNSRTSKKPEVSTLIGKGGMVMPDREKVIKEFEHLLNTAKDNYQDFVDLTVDVGDKILALLKEQETKAGHWIDTTKVIGFPRVQCSVCGSGQGAIWMDYCPNCGAKMKGR